MYESRTMECALNMLPLWPYGPYHGLMRIIIKRKDNEEIE